MASPNPVVPVVSCGLPLIARVNWYKPETAPVWKLLRRFTRRSTPVLIVCLPHRMLTLSAS